MTFASLEMENKTPLKTPSTSNAGQSPRCEAFLMTGDKMLILDPKISPCYAQVNQGQLLPSVELYNGKGYVKTGSFDDFSKDVQPIANAKRLVGSSQSATSTPIKRQSGSTITPDDCNSLAPSVTFGGGGGNAVAVSSSAATSQYDSTVDGVESSAKRRLRRDESSLSDITTTLSMTMPRAETITRIATQLFTLQAGYTLADITTFLSRRDCELSQKVANEFMSFFNFSGKRLDVALREFLSHVALSGETSERAHILTHFSTRYFHCNSTLFCGIDEIHALVCALILLNSDLHGANVSNKMTMREFVDNLLHTQYEYDRNMLKTLYNAVKESPFLRVEDSLAATAIFRSSADNDQLPSIATSEKASSALLSDISEVSRPRHPRETSVATAVSIVSPVTELSCETQCRRKSNERKKKRRNTISIREQQDLSLFVNPREQVDYKRGWLLKKSVYDPDGRRTPFGRRKWQMCYATLRGMVLYLHKNEKVFERSRHETFAHCIRLHHSIAEVARDYKKRHYVFRLRTANFGEILFETSEHVEVQRWIDAINYVSAAFSTPPLPMAISSAETESGAPPAAFFRFPPALPVAPTTLSMVEQLRAHCERLDEVTEALEKLRAVAPSIKAKGRTVYEYFYRERYLDKERERYAIYVSILDKRLKAVSQADISSMTSSCIVKKTPSKQANDN